MKSLALLLALAAALPLTGCTPRTHSTTEPALSDPIPQGTETPPPAAEENTPEASTPEPTTLEEALLGPVNTAIEAGMPGVIVYARKGSEETLFARGMADVDGQVPMRPDHMFRIASNSKTYLAALAAKLHSAGTFSLDTPIQDILTADAIAGIANTDQVTTRQLLNHTSGIYDYFDSDAVWDAMLDDPTHQWTALEALDYIRNVAAAFSPGAQHGYSNSNYLLAGLVIDQLTGAHHSAAIQRDILDAAGLTQSYYESHTEAVGELCHGYGDYKDDSAVDDSFAFNHGYGLADGGMVTTAEDLAKFYDALNDDTLLDATAKAALFDNPIEIDGGTAGLGIFIESFEGTDVWMHGGGVVGYLSDIFYYPDTGDVVVFFANGSEGNLDTIYDELWEEMATAFDEY